MWHPKSRIWRGSLARVMGRHYWRFTTYQGLLGRAGLLPYRRWAWSAWAAARGLREQTKARKDSERCPT